ncbi:MAG: dienelactone hydrolase family protein, partial [Terriglobales bacterium]
MSNEKSNDVQPGEVGRRDFVGLSMAAGVAAATATASAAGMPVGETNVEIKMPDGVCDAAFIHPLQGSHPGVLLWPDAFGLRPSMREMAKRLAAEGYSVL